MSKTFRRLSHNYHDALLERCDVGLERELTLDIRLDPVVDLAHNGAIIIETSQMPQDQ